MATIKISELNELTSAADVTSTDLLHIINKEQTSSEYPTGTNRSIKASTLADGLGGLLTTIPPVIQTALDAKLNTSAYDPAGIKVATPVRAASTVTLTLSGINNGSSIDGVTLATGNRVLIKNQSTATQNGIYVVNASGGLTRATDFASGTDVKGYFVLVTAGTTQNGSGWAVTSDPAVIGTDSIIFTQFSSALGSVTKESLGLGNVNNTSDLNKPVSTLTQTALDTKQATITGAASTITTTNLTASRALVSNGNGKVAASSITSTELNYLDNVSSNIQTQLNGKASTSDLTTKQNIITGAASTITSSNLTASRALMSNSSGKVDASTITTTELGYLSGVTSNIQTQLNGKASGTVTSVTGSGPINVANGTTTPAISIDLATTSSRGAMSSTDKTRLDDASGVNGLVKCNGSGNFSAAVAGVDYLTASDNILAIATGSVRLGPTGVSGQSGTAQTLTASKFRGNISSFVWESRGYYKVTFATAMSDTNYTVIAQNAPAHDPQWPDDNGNSEWHDYTSPGYFQEGNENPLFIMNKTVNSFYILCWSNESNVKENLNGLAFAVFA